MVPSHAESGSRLCFVFFVSCYDLCCLAGFYVLFRIIKSFLGQGKEYFPSLQYRSVSVSYLAFL